MVESLRLGKRIRTLRTKAGLTQAALAGRLGISASYLNLIENDRRPVSAAVLLGVAKEFDVDLRVLAPEGEARLEADLQEVFGDPLFHDTPVSTHEIRDIVSAGSDVSNAILHLYHSFIAAQGSAEALSEQVVDGPDLELDRSRLSSEQVSDLIQRHSNHFPALEDAAEKLASDAGFTPGELFSELPQFLERRYSVKVRICTVSEMNGALRRFDGDRGELLISEALRRGSRNFQMAHQIGRLACPQVLARIADDRFLTSGESKALCRVALANYFAAALLMPYEPFRRATEELRYDLDLLGHRFKASFEQVCHRLTTLGRRGAEGIPFHMIRVDLAGNISKKLGAGGIHFPRFSGLCPLWNVHAAFLQPGTIRAELARLPDGTRFFTIARTVRKHRGGYHAPNILHAISFGCDVESARAMVYSDGIDLENADAAVPVGLTCRLCDRSDCKARTQPSLRRILRVDEDVLGESFYSHPD